jgi:WD40 repeat protein
VELRDIDSDCLRSRLIYSGQELTNLVFSPDGRHLASIDSAGVVRIIQTKEQLPTDPIELTSRLKTPRDCSLQIAFDPRGSSLAIAGIGAEGHEVQIWNIQTHELKHTIVDHGDCVFQLKYTTNGRRIATACRDRHLRIFDSDSGVIVADYILPQHVKALSIAPDGTFIAAGGSKGVLRIFDCVFAASSISTEYLAETIAKHKISGADSLTSADIEAIGRFAEGAKEKWTNLSQQIAAAISSRRISSDETAQIEGLFNKWQYHRQMAFDLETH